MAPWSSGQDASLSRWNQGFDSPRSHCTKSRKVLQKDLTGFFFACFSAKQDHRDDDRFLRLNRPAEENKIVFLSWMGYNRKRFKTIKQSRRPGLTVPAGKLELEEKSMLVSATEMLQKAKAGHYAVGQFNINNLEWTKAILLTAQECNSPVILGVSEGAGKYMTGYKTVVGMVNGMLEELNITVPVALHLDHGSYEGCLKCVEAGFSSIMFDGSHYPIDENVAKTTELVKIAHEHNMSLEAEVGSIGGEEDGVIGRGECADPDECKRIADLGIDFLAAGIGNIHGVYPDNWEGLSFETLDAIQQKTGTMPLVLHGGTGIPDDMIKKAIDLGVAKINVNTECQLVFAEATRKYIEEGKDQQGKGFDPRKLLKPGTEAIMAKVKEKMELFGSVGKA